MSMGQGVECGALMMMAYVQRVMKVLMNVALPCIWKLDASPPGALELATSGGSAPLHWCSMSCFSLPSFSCHLRCAKMTGSSS